MPRAARVYLATVLGAAGAAAAAAPLGGLAVTGEDWALFGALALAAAVAHLFVVRTPTNQAYHTTIAFVVPAVVLLPPALVVVLVLLAHLPEYLRERYPWYIASFNVANYTLDALAAWAVFHALATPSQGRWAVAAFAAAATMVLANHGLLAGMLRLGRAHSIRETGLFTADSLATDLAPAVLGVVIGYAAHDNYALVLAAVLPLVFLYRALRIPALHEARAEQSARAERQTRLTSLGLAAMSETPAHVVLDEAMAIARDGLGMTAGYLLELDDDGEGRVTPRFRARLGLAGRGAEPGAEVDGLVEHTLASDGPVVVTDVAADERFAASPVARAAGAGSSLAVVVPGPDGPIGVLALFSPYARAFRDDDLHSLQALATTMSVVIDRERSQLALRQSEERRQEVLDVMLRAEEEERLRIATELHDDTIQVMTATLLGMDGLERRIAREDVAGALTAVGRVRSTLADAVERTRRLTFELRPPLLEANGLGVALQELAEQVGREAGFESTVTANVGRYRFAVEDLTYRIMQEAIANVRKHARATELRVQLIEQDGALHGLVVDNGCGFDVVSALDRSRMRLHLGLDALIERVRLARGIVTLHSQPGEGSRLSFSLPLDADPTDAESAAEPRPAPLGLLRSVA